MHSSLNTPTAPARGWTSLVNRARRGLVLGAAWLALGAGTAHAQGGPVLKFVVPYPAGGVTDVAARILADEMSRALGQTVIVENRPGGGGRIATAAVAQGPKDASTLLFTNIGFSTLPLVEKNVGFDAFTSFAPVGLAAEYGAVLVVRQGLPVNDLAGLVALARQQPGKLNYGSAGVGSAAHFVGEYLKSLTGTFMVHIPYRSTSAALNDVAGGLLDLTVDANAKPLIDAGKVKALAVVASQRDARMPGVPTAAEAGVKGLEFNAWLGLMAPAGTDPRQVEKLNQAMNTALKSEALQKRYADLGLWLRGGAPARLTEQLRKDAGFYGKVIKEARLKFDE